MSRKNNSVTRTALHTNTLRRLSGGEDRCREYMLPNGTLVIECKKPKKPKT